MIHIGNEKMIKIGITTHYTGSTNYGGCLQAFALQKELHYMGYSAMQIRFRSTDIRINQRIRRTIKSKRVFDVLKTGIKLRINKLIGKIANAEPQIRTFKESFNAFRDSIPHTTITYDNKSITNCTDFDIYITGSDQVWNIGVANYFSVFHWLSFVTKDKKKISYAASISKMDFPKELYPKVRKLLSDYSAISVREKQDKELLDKILGKGKVRWVLDPTLLLSRKEWDEQCTTNPFKDKKYVFVYLLGDNKKQRQFVTTWAKKNNRIVINIPYLLGQYRSCDRKFGDIRKSDVTPNLWLSLIRDADCVFTDSFHATVFSSIFHTPFYVFKRNKDTEKASMNSRIYSLTELLGCENRIIENNADIDSIPALDDIDFDQADKNVAIKREESISFLKKALEE